MEKGGPTSAGGASAFSRSDQSSVRVEQLAVALPDGSRYAVIRIGENGDEHIYYPSKADADAAAQRIRAEGGGEQTAPRAVDRAQQLQPASNKPATWDAPELGLAIERVVAKRATNSVRSAQDALRRQDAGQLKQRQDRKGFCFKIAAEASASGLGDMVIGLTGNGQGGTDWEKSAGMISSPIGMRVVNFGAMADNGKFRDAIKKAAGTLAIDEVESVDFASDGALVENDCWRRPKTEPLMRAVPIQN